MENLLVLLDKIQQVSPLPIFSKDVIVVQNAGMQHWLNMSLAKQRGISMNVDYALPSQFLWKLVRTIASEEYVPDQSPFSREVLAWRIFTLFAQEQVINDADFDTATQYWRTTTTRAKASSVETNSVETNSVETNSVETNSAEAGNIQTANVSNHTHQHSHKAFTSQEQLKRYQLACQMADLFEQYLIFRPEWINDWENGRFSAGSKSNSTSADSNTNTNTNTISATTNDTANDVSDIAKWQGKLWYLLTREQSYNPITLIEQAISELKHKRDTLPERISFFGINIMAPMWLSFVNELSEYVDVHFFHLNPCYAYWGDVITEKQAIRSINQWVDGYDDIAQSVGNPLLANLGQQGREFMALLHNYSTINIDVFDLAFEQNSQAEINSDDINQNEINPNEINQSEKKQTEAKPASVLQHVQHDILTLHDARTAPTTYTDNSIVVTSCHSALREVQGLHDWLLHQFNHDSELTPKDVLVMCPQVEEYAPYVNAVFARGWQDFDDKVPPLPCSIADRVSKESEPVVAAFSDLLTLPDSRFQVSQLMSFLRIPAMQTKFDLSTEDIDKVSIWLEHASVHWGLNEQHKQQTLNTESVSNSFTWQQGLSRLLRGSAYGDYEVIYNNQLLLPTVEGNDGELLGKMMLILEQLQHFARNLTKARTAKQWQTFLHELINELFEIDNDDGFSIVTQAIESLIDYCLHAKFEENIDLLIIRDFLNQHFSQPDPGRQFIVGQVTFCSMLPMRSIPFKVIAILGLNDGLFPRQRQPLSFDLMSVTPAMLGDRSRRGDDRYLFLEAIISARKALYLSYQGKNIKNNAPKQASLVLKELMEYLTLGYGWHFSEDSTETHTDTTAEKNTEINIATNAETSQSNQLRHLPLQPFSLKNYQGKVKSFDNHWLHLAQQSVTEQTSHKQTPHEQALTLSIPLPDLLEYDALEACYVMHINLSQLVSFFQHPSKYFAKTQLNLNLEPSALALEDVEPFEFDRLQSYLLREQLIKAQLTPEASNEEVTKAVQQCITAAKLSGKFPEAITRDKVFENWTLDSELFSHAIKEHNAVVNQQENCTVTFELDNHTSQLLIEAHHASNENAVSGTVNYNGVAEDQHITTAEGSVKVRLSTQLPISDNKLVFYRSSSPKFKDFITLYFHQCMVNLAKSELSNTSADYLHAIAATHGFYFDTKSQKVTQFVYRDVLNPKTQLLNCVTQYITGLQQPLLVNGEIAEKAFKAKVFEQTHFEQYWRDPNAMMPIGNDPYVYYFWPECPDYNTVHAQLEHLYADMFNAREQIK